MKQFILMSDPKRIQMNGFPLKDNTKIGITRCY